MKRGELWVVNLEPGFGRELHKKRPALIISNNDINQSATKLIIIPASSQVPLFAGPELVLIDKPEGVDKPSVLMPIFIRSIDQQRLIKKIGALSKIKMQEVKQALLLVLDLL